MTQRLLRAGDEDSAASCGWHPTLGTSSTGASTGREGSPTRLRGDSCAHRPLASPQRGGEARRRTAEFAARMQGAAALSGRWSAAPGAESHGEGDAQRFRYDAAGLDETIAAMNLSVRGRLGAVGTRGRG